MSLTLAEPLAASADQRQTLEAIERAVQRGADLIDDLGNRVPLSETVRTVLLQATHELIRGNRVSLVPVGTMLTTQQSAEMLNVSRPYLVRLLESGEIPFEMVGTHRRISLDDVLAYRAERSRTRREALRHLSDEADELGIYTE